jgi:cytochrome c2
MSWPLSDRQGRHDGYVKPMFAWTPSIGISQVIALEGGLFPHWQGDIIVSSLAAQSLFRVRVEDERVVLVEPILIGSRIRDMVEAPDGSIVLKTDDDFLVYIAPLDAASAATPVERGALLAAQCQSCHSMTQDGTAAIGPGLWNVVGRPVASGEDFNYSPSLRAAGGRWTPERLRSFLAAPDSFAPGTTMQLGTSYDQNQLDDLISYLRTLR